jgi:DNA adenine methylase
MSRLTQPLKWHGGKHYLAGKIVPLMPRHLHYVEPYAGGLSVLLARDPEDRRLWLEENPPAHHRGVSEVVNDLHGDLMCFWATLRDARESLYERLAATEFGEDVWRRARDYLAALPPWDGTTDVTRAWAFFILCRQSLAGRMAGFASISRTRTRGNRNEQANAWRGAVEGLPAVAERLRDVVVLNRPALEVIRQQDGPGTLFYLDPPYVHQTRTAQDVYDYEMTEGDHRQLLGALQQCKGKVMLSGYPSALYDTALAGWDWHAFDLPNNSAGGESKGRELEVLWTSYPSGGRRGKTMDLFVQQQAG